MKPYEQEIVEWQAAVVTYEDRRAAEAARLARFAAEEAGEGMPILRQSIPAAPPPKPVYHSWPPPADASLVVRFDRATAHFAEKLMDPTLRAAIGPLLEVLRQVVTGAEAETVTEAEEARFRSLWERERERDCSQ